MAGHEREIALLSGQAAANAIDDGRSWEEAMAAGRAVADAKASGMSTWEAMSMAQAAALGMHSYEMVLLQGKQELRRWQMKPQPDAVEPVETYLDTVLSEEQLSGLMTTEKMVDSLSRTVGGTETAGSAEESRKTAANKDGCAVM